MAKLYTYVVREDTGLAPNPYWGFCSVAVCTPNHQGSRIKKGDWLAGFLTKDRGHRLLFAMETSEILDLDDYYRDARFQKKKPNLRGTWMERCGDNFYSRSVDGQWIQHRNRFHLGDSHKSQDTKHARVFIGSQFWYLGSSAKALPSEMAELAGGRGTRVGHDLSVVSQFMAWVASTVPLGVNDLPNDNPDI